MTRSSSACFWVLTLCQASSSSARVPSWTDTVRTRRTARAAIRRIAFYALSARSNSGATSWSTAPRPRRTLAPGHDDRQVPDVWNPSAIALRIPGRHTSLAGSAPTTSSPCSRMTCRPAHDVVPASAACSRFCLDTSRSSSADESDPAARPPDVTSRCRWNQPRSATHSPTLTPRSHLPSRSSHALSTSPMQQITVIDIISGPLRMPDGRFIRLATPVFVRLATWLDNWAKRWRRTKNPDLLVTTQTAHRLPPPRPDLPLEQDRCDRNTPQRPDSLQSRANRPGRPTHLPTALAQTSPLSRPKLTDAWLRSGDAWSGR